MRTFCITILTLDLAACTTTQTRLANVDNVGRMR